MQAAKQDMVPPNCMLRQIADLENAIAAIKAVAEEETDRGGGRGATLVRSKHDQEIIGS